ncbi:MAG: hypothetical protein ACREP7_00635 [Lysobacter sp.]
MRRCENSSDSSANFRLERLREAGRRFEAQVANGRFEPRPIPGCRLQWRPSHLLCAALIALGLMAACSVVATELPLPVSLPLAGVALTWAVRSARREARRPALAMVIAAGRASLAGVPIRDLRLHWRGWLARLEFCGPDGRRQRLLWWPDRLDAAGRRELRLAVAVIDPAGDPRSMAP